MTINPELADKFWKIIEVNDITWNVIDNVAMSDANILRPIKGVCFETLFIKSIKENKTTTEIKSGTGDEDTDLHLNGYKLQLKTAAENQTIPGKKIAVNLHKTHGNETRPHNLYNITKNHFDFLVVLHPTQGILIIPYSEIPEDDNWKGYFADPAYFDWNSSWINRWDLLDLPELKGKNIEVRRIPSNSSLPKLSSSTYLEDFEIIETLCKPEYFRAAVMGLKGNIKEELMYQYLKKNNYMVSKPEGPYPKYDFIVKNKEGQEFRVQAKGTSKNLCDELKGRIGIEAMSTHRQFPMRGYRKRDFEYLVAVISNHQIPSKYCEGAGPHFLFIPVEDLPLHYKIDLADVRKEWKYPEYNDVIYPNIKLKFFYDKSTNKLKFKPNLSAYRNTTIPSNSTFRSAGPYTLDEIPKNFK